MSDLNHQSSSHTIHTIHSINNQNTIKSHSIESCNHNNNPIKRVFSVDDDPQEIENDFLTNQSSISSFHLPQRYVNENYYKTISSPRITSRGKSPRPIRLISNNSIPLFQSDSMSKTPSKNLPDLEESFAFHSNNTSTRNSNNLNTNTNHNNNINNNTVLSNPNNNISNDQVSIASSLESFTLRERQEAINETHPFGIRIWKPALYKKIRSVQKTANEDIHETKLKKIPWYVTLSNVIWCLTIGILLFIINFITAIVVLSFGLFTKSSREYSLVLFKLSLYFLWPFGKAVYLITDEKYLEEDRDEGISVQQFYQWVTSYKHKLFFQQPANPSHTPILNTTEPLLSNINPNSDTQAVNNINSPHNYGSIQSNNNSNEIQSATNRRYFGRGKWTLGRIVFYICFHVLIQPVGLFFALITWLGVFTIPMSNILWNLMYHCRKHPLALGFKSISTTNKQDNNVNQPIPINEDDIEKNILLCTFRAAGWHYYKYTVDGTNVIVVNLLSIVFFTIFDFFILRNKFGFTHGLSNQFLVFVLSLVSIIPLAFYIGQAVASISAQTSMGIGAVLNAFFSTIVEIYLYCFALSQNKGKLVEGSIAGSILGAVLLLPGLSMCGGALKRKTQRYNPASAGVSSALLIFSMIVMFIPTIFYDIYGGYNVICKDGTKFIETTTKKQGQKCYFKHPPLKYNKMFSQVLEPLSCVCAIVLFLAYFIGLWFTLRTHAKLIWQLPIAELQTKDNITTPYSTGQNENVFENNLTINQNVPSNDHAAENAHSAPNWSKPKSTTILLCATLLYAMIAEILVDSVDTVLEDFPGLDPKVLGLTIFALVPSTTEFLNAISFAINGNVALSMEIGSAYALQVCLLQIPALVIYSVFYTWKTDTSQIDVSSQMFALIFQRWDFLSLVSSTVLFTYLYAEGKSNYFKGSMMVLLYCITILGFYFQGVLGAMEP